jgi:hypothetical protein
MHLKIKIIEAKVPLHEHYNTFSIEFYLIKEQTDMCAQDFLHIICKGWLGDKLTRLKIQIQKYFKILIHAILTKIQKNGIISTRWSPHLMYAKEIRLASCDLLRDDL